jgi:hypothetical protein
MTGNQHPAMNLMGERSLRYLKFISHVKDETSQLFQSWHCGKRTDLLSTGGNPIADFGVVLPG